MKAKITSKNGDVEIYEVGTYLTMAEEDHLGD